MPVHFITGKLGAGKSLNSVARIKERLEKGLPVATNLNIHLPSMLGRDKKTRNFIGYLTSLSCLTLKL